MSPYQVKTFVLPSLDGISDKTMQTHVKLYEGYVKQTNDLLERSAELESNHPAIWAIQRRFGFEFDGMRNHEYYFEGFEGGHAPLSESSSLHKAITATWGSIDEWLDRFKMIAMTRGIGWAILYHDQKTNRLLNHWVDEQHLGHLLGLTPIVTLDMWEHSYLLDYAPADKAQYIDAFFKNLNWDIVAQRFSPTA